MRNGCVVCRGLDRSIKDATGKRLFKLNVEDRLVTVCAEHRQAIKNSTPVSWHELRALFREENGRRSLIGRRAELDRRMFPARPEGRRRAERRREQSADPESD